MTLAARTRKFWDAVKAKNIVGISEAYFPSEDTYVILEGPRYSTKGVEKIIKGWGDFCSSAITMTGIEWEEGPFEEIEGDMGWIGGIFNIHLSVNQKEFSNKFRCSFVFRCYEDDWKIKHEHVSAPMQDPYGIGDWLKKS